MAWIYELKTHYRVKEQRTYPWPCAPEPKRTLELFPFDVLTKAKDGSVTKHNGLCMTGIIVPECDLVEVQEPLSMVIGS